jgi:DNA-binding IclR family transcriptional regulator
MELRMTQNVVQSVDRALRLMWQVRDHPGITLTALSSAGELLPSTTLRLMGTLQQHRLVERDRATKGYRLGPAAFSLSGDSHNRSNISLAARLQPIVDELAGAVHEQVSLAVLEGRCVEHILSIDGASQAGQELILRSPRGRRDANVNATALGKAFLAHAPADVRDDIIAGLSFEKTASDTITDAEELRRHLAQVRRRGCAFSINENTDLVAGVAAPIRQNEIVIAALAVHGPSARLSASRLRAIAPVVRKAAADCSAALT